MYTLHLALTRVPGFLRGIVCVILSLAILIQYQSVANKYTPTVTHDDRIYFDSIVSHDKNFARKWERNSIPEELSCMVFVQFHHHIHQNHLGQMYRAHLINATQVYISINTSMQLLTSGAATAPLVADKK